MAAAAPVINIEKFLEERRTGIGGSDIHHMFGLEPYGCRRWLYYEKTNQTPDFPRETTPQMRRGIRLEHVAAEEYSIETGRRLESAGILRSEDNPRLMVHVDRLINDQGRGRGTLEIKTCNREIWWQIQKTGFAQSAVLQLQHALGITNHTWGAICVFWADGWEMRDADIERDEKLIDLIRAEAVDFWARIENRDIPDALRPGDKRCRRCIYRYTCHELPELAEARDDVVLDPSLAGLAEEYLEISELAKQAEWQKDEVKAELEAAMGDRTVVQWSEDRRDKITFGVTDRGGFEVKPTKFRALRVWTGKE